MEQLKDKIKALFDKFKFPLIVLVAGLALLAIPFGDFGKGQRSEENVPVRTEESLETKLEAILSEISGAGAVRVLLTEANGKETIYQTDIGNQSDKTVTVKGDTREDSGLVRQVNSEIYRGALVVCDGADIPSVKFAIEEAVSKATGLGADKISIQKLK